MKGGDRVLSSWRTMSESVALFFFLFVFLSFALSQNKLDSAGISYVLSILVLLAVDETEA